MVRLEGVRWKCEAECLSLGPLMIEKNTRDSAVVSVECLITAPRASCPGLAPLRFTVQARKDEAATGAKTKVTRLGRVSLPRNQKPASDF